MVLVKQYKKHRIERSANGVIEVVDGRGSRFIVAFDETKPTGQKHIEELNNVTSAKKYIDWLTKVDKKQRK